MGTSQLGVNERLQHVRHHLAHAIMGLTSVSRDLDEIVPGFELHASVRTLHQICDTLDGWIGRVRDLSPETG